MRASRTWTIAIFLSGLGAGASITHAQVSPDVYLEISRTAANLAWKQADLREGASHVYYRVEWGFSDDNFQYSMNVGTATEAHIYPLSHDATYLFRLMAYDELGDWEKPSNTVIGELPPFGEGTVACGAITKDTTWPA